MNSNQQTRTTATRTSTRHYQTFLKSAMFLSAILLKQQTVFTRAYVSQRCTNRRSISFGNVHSFHLNKISSQTEKIFSKNNSCQQHRYSTSIVGLYSTTSENENQTDDANNSSKDGTTKRRKKRSNNRYSKDKRREFIGKAKAVDRGQWSAVYSPGGDDRINFTAKSGLPDRTKPFTVLGIESSCDDTGAAVVRSDGVILGESLASQNEIHEEWGGIVPGLAKNAHEEKIDSVISEALHNAGLTIEEVDAIGVTIGPGLEICLRVGCNKARELAMEFKKPFVGIHHLEAHILMARLPFDPNSAQFLEGGTDEVHESKRAIEFPFLALLVSGGHCQLLKCLGIGNYQIIGGTIDDSLGKFGFVLETSENNISTFLNHYVLNLHCKKVRRSTKLQDY